MVRGVLAVVGVAFVATAWSGACDAQRIRRSQRGSVMQMIGPVEATITYSRPVARGRTIFGALVRWGETWTPGADSATLIRLSDTLLVAGHPLAPGEYSIWATPGPEEWTIIFSDRAHVFHLPYPGTEHDVLRITATPQSGPYMETMTFHFPVVDGSRAVLAFHWERTVVEVPLELPGQR